MSNHHKFAIDILCETTDFKKLCFEIAKYSPYAFVVAKGRLNAVRVVDSSWRDECLKIKTEFGMVEAIKRCRELTGMELMEAKRAVIAL